MFFLFFCSPQNYKLYVIILSFQLLLFCIFLKKIKTIENIFQNLSAVVVKDFLYFGFFFLKNLFCSIHVYELLVLVFVLFYLIFFFILRGSVSLERNCLKKSKYSVCLLDIIMIVLRHNDIQLYHRLTTLTQYDMDIVVVSNPYVVYVCRLKLSELREICICFIIHSVIHFFNQTKAFIQFDSCVTCHLVTIGINELIFCFLCLL